MSYIRKKIDTVYWYCLECFDTPFALGKPKPSQNFLFNCVIRFHVEGELKVYQYANPPLQKQISYQQGLLLLLF